MDDQERLPVRATYDIRVVVRGGDDLEVPTLSELSAMVSDALEGIREEGGTLTVKAERVDQ